MFAEPGANSLYLHTFCISPAWPQALQIQTASGDAGWVFHGAVGRFWGCFHKKQHSRPVELGWDAEGHTTG